MRSKFQLGDFVENVLSYVGITKYRYVQLKFFLGLQKRCGCDRRKHWLNTFGDRIAQLVQGVMAYFIPVPEPRIGPTPRKIYCRRGRRRTPAENAARQRLIDQGRI